MSVASADKGSRGLLVDDLDVEITSNVQFSWERSRPERIISIQGAQIWAENVGVEILSASGN